MRFSKRRKRLLRTGIVFVVLLAAAAVLLHAGYIRFQKSVYPQKYPDLVGKSAEQYGLEPELVYAVIRAESSFDPDAQSRAGALGLMQLMPETFDWLQQKEGGGIAYTEEDLFRPEINIKYGCRFLSMMTRKYGVLRTALCAYNAGAGTVDGWLKDARYSADGKNLDRIPYEETRNYADAVEQNYLQYKKLYE